MLEQSLPRVIYSLAIEEKVNKTSAILLSVRILYKKICSLTGVYFMNENIFWTNHEDIELEVTLKSGRVPPKKLKCVYLRTYDGQFDSCDAHVFQTGMAHRLQAVVDRINYRP